MVVTGIVLATNDPRPTITSMESPQTPLGPRKDIIPHKSDVFRKAAQLLRTSSNIVILTGAGISTSLGIPDFRSAGSGLYDQLEDEGIDMDPQDVFHIDTFHFDPTIFYRVAKKLYATSESTSTGIPMITPTHEFIRTLQNCGKLLTNYTQNIDGLETVAGIRAEKLIQAHGSLWTGSCLRCEKSYGEEFRCNLVRGVPLWCPKCLGQSATEVAKSGNCKHGRKSPSTKRRKRVHDFMDESTEDCVIRPDMTFFGEPLSDAYAKRLETDKLTADLLIIIGTSMSVGPLNKLPSEMPPNMPQIYISRSAYKGRGAQPDIQLLGECDSVVANLVEEAGLSQKVE